MCRAFVGIELDKTGKVNKDLRSAAMNYMYNGRDKGNDDGFHYSWFGLDNKIHSLRTLNFVRILEFMAKQPANHVFHGHARAANRGGATEEFIHGWHYQGFTCSHNGTIVIAKDKDTSLNDSQSFFNLVFKQAWTEDLDNFVEGIKEVCEEDVESGQGVFFMVSKDFTIAVALSKTMYLNKVNKNLILLNSQNDIHTFKDELTLDVDFTTTPREEDLGEGIMVKNEAKRTEEMVWPTPIDIEETMTGSIENAIIVLDNHTGKVIRRVGITPPKGLFRGGNSSTGQASSSSGTPRTTTHVDMSRVINIEELTGRYFNMQKELKDAFRSEMDLDSMTSPKDDKAKGEADTVDSVVESGYV